MELSGRMTLGRPFGELLSPRLQPPHMKCYQMLECLQRSRAPVRRDGSVNVHVSDIHVSFGKVREALARCTRCFLTVLSVQTRYTAAKDSVVQFFFYQPISHQWRQTDFFPCTVTCGGGEAQTSSLNI